MSEIATNVVLRCSRPQTLALIFLKFLQCYSALFVRCFDAQCYCNSSRCSSTTVCSTDLIMKNIKHKNCLHKYTAATRSMCSTTTCSHIIYYNLHIHNVVAIKMHATLQRYNANNPKQCDEQAPYLQVLVVECILLFYKRYPNRECKQSTVVNYASNVSIAINHCIPHLHPLLENFDNYCAYKFKAALRIYIYIVHEYTLK